MARHVKIVNRKRGWCALEIPRCGCTGLKVRAWRDNIEEPIPENVHAAMGYGHETSHGLVVEWDYPTDGLFHFAVWRPPVARSYSTWLGLVRVNPCHAAFWSVQYSNWDEWVSFVRALLALNGPASDPHIRRQRDFYHDNDVDAIIPIWHLDEFLSDKFDECIMGKCNSSRAVESPCHLSPFATEEIARLYACDSAIQLSKKFAY